MSGTPDGKKGGCAIAEKNLWDVGEGDLSRARWRGTGGCNVRALNRISQSNKKGTVRKNRVAEKI